MKADPHAPEHAAEIARIADAAAATALHEAEAAGWDRMTAGVCLMRAAVAVLLTAAPPAVLVEWIRKQAADLEALHGAGGSA